MLNNKLLYREGGGSRNDPCRFNLTQKGKKWIRSNVDYIATNIKMINCLGGIGCGKILSLNSRGIKYITENLQKLENKIR